MTTVFIDGNQGTTGLRIHARLSSRADVQLRTLPDAQRKDPAARAAYLNEADAAFLCLPDDAAREAVGMLQSDTVIIDASTAHRTAPGWAYAFPELSGAHRTGLLDARRIAVPGCHASGFAALVYPLTAAGLLRADAPVCCHSITGYSGGGKAMIAAYENAGRTEDLAAPRQYALTQQHKHLPEMQAVCGLTSPPHFTPIVADYYAGMAVTVPLFAEQLTYAVTPDALRALYAAHYADSALIRVLPETNPDQASGYLAANTMAGRDGMELFVTGNSTRLTVVARFDNLGKGASGAAVQAFNLRFGLGETTGLVL